MRPEVLVVIDILKDFHDELGADCVVRHPGGAEDPGAFLGEVAPAIRAIVTNGTTGADAALMDALPNLELIAVFSAGYENVDVALRLLGSGG